MTSLKERSVFFPSQKFDGRNKDLTKQHWQAFQDFCHQQKLYIENTDDHRAATINEVQPFFKMTLTDLARAWLERETFTSPADLKEKFLRDFSPYGKTPRQWIAKWAALKFNPDTDNCRGITRIHRSPSRPSHPYGRQAAFINIHEHPL